MRRLYALAAFLAMFAAGCANRETVEIKACKVTVVHPKVGPSFLAFAMTLQNNSSKVAERTDLQYAIPGAAAKTSYVYRTPIDAHATQTVMFASNGIPRGAAPHSGPIDCTISAVHYRT